MLRWLILIVPLAVAGRRVFLGYSDPAVAHRRLARREAAFLRASADAIYPQGGAVPASGSEAGVAEWVDRYLDAVGGRSRLLMRLLFFLVEHATLAFPAPGPRGFRRFSSLAPEQQVAVLESWRVSRLFLRRLVFTSLRAILTLGYLADPAVQRALSLAPRAIEPPLCEADFLYPPIGAAPSEARRRPPGWAMSEPAPPLGPETPLHPDYLAGPGAAPAPRPALGGR